MQTDRDPLLIQDSDARRFEKEIHAMVPELNRPFKLENARLDHSVLKTTYEEFLILYPVEARFRQGYAESETLVSIPNLFVKIFSDAAGKARLQQQLAADTTVGLLKTGFNSPLYQRCYGEACDLSRFYQEGVLDCEGLKNDPAYGLAALKTSYQNLWLGKLEHLLNHRGELFTEAFTLTSAEIIETVVRLRPAVIEMYNWFDFQGPLPKLLADDSARPYDAREAMRASLILLFLVLCDVDVVVLNDSQGATFENYIREDCYSRFYPQPAPAQGAKPAIGWLLMAGAFLLLAFIGLILKTIF